MLRKNKRAFEVVGDSTVPGAKIRMMIWDNTKDAQLFYDDPETGIIRSKLNGFYLQVEGSNIDGRLSLITLDWRVIRRVLLVNMLFCVNAASCTVRLS